MQRRFGPSRVSPGTGIANPLQAAQRLAEAERQRQTGNLNQALSLCESLLLEYPDYVGALQTLGVTQLTKRNYRQALSCFIQAAMHCPKDSVNLTNLATAYLRLGARELASQTLEQARRIKSDDATVDFALAAVYREDREYELAAAAYRRVLTRVPSSDAAHGLGDCCTHLGRVAEAAAALKQAHELKPDSVAVLYALSQLPASATDVHILPALDRVRRGEEQDQDDFDTFVAFTRAASLDRQGRHTEAWEALLEANRREFPKHEAEYRGQNARMEAARHDARQTIARADVRRRTPQSYPLSVFIVGPSRSGKTTVERLLGQLEGLKCGYENRLVERASRRTSQLSGLLTLRNPSDLPKALDDRFRASYLEEVQEFARGAKIVTDTYPAMIPYVGRVATALPNVRFIFVKRDRYDCALRIFMKHYRAGNHYAYDIKTIFHYVAWYYEMVELWLEKFPEISLSIDYEDAVAEPKATLSRIIEFCGANLDGRFPLDLGNDHGCSRAYREFIDTAIREDRRDLIWLR
jgi:tetratricopeptide (TPR) repeat protein